MTAEWWPGVTGPDDVPQAPGAPERYRREVQGVMGAQDRAIQPRGPTWLYIGINWEDF